jgi:hypothetical protein
VAVVEKCVADCAAILTGDQDPHPSGIARPEIPG